VPIIDGRSRKPRYLPLGVPSIYANEIKEFHDNPFVFWASQILNYIMRFKPEFEAILNENSKRLGLRTPCVGLDICLIENNLSIFLINSYFSVHVRRTDKIGSEAAFHDVGEYMEHVHNFFDTYELIHPNISFKRAVYLATDEISAISDMEK
jgi:glycoprotein 6-alpha-L-fucosyltransferase